MGEQSEKATFWLSVTRGSFLGLSGQLPEAGANMTVGGFPANVMRREEAEDHDERG